MPRPAPAQSRPFVPDLYPTPEESPVGTPLSLSRSVTIAKVDPITGGIPFAKQKPVLRAQFWTGEALQQQLKIETRVKSGSSTPGTPGKLVNSVPATPALTKDGGATPATLHGAGTPAELLPEEEAAERQPPQASVQAGGALLTIPEESKTPNPFRASKFLATPQDTEQLQAELKKLQASLPADRQQTEMESLEEQVQFLRADAELLKREIAAGQRGLATDHPRAALELALERIDFMSRRGVYGDLNKAPIRPEELFTSDFRTPRTLRVESAPASAAEPVAATPAEKNAARAWLSRRKAALQKAVGWRSKSASTASEAVPAASTAPADDRVVGISPSERIPHLESLEAMGLTAMQRPDVSHLTKNRRDDDVDRMIVRADRALAGLRSNVTSSKNRAYARTREILQDPALAGSGLEREQQARLAGVGYFGDVLLRQTPDGQGGTRMEGLIADRDDAVRHACLIAMSEHYGNSPVPKDDHFFNVATALSPAITPEVFENYRRNPFARPL
jgi:hypothetical protein